MAKPYANEMSKLADTFAWAKTADIEPLRKAIKAGSTSPLLAIGSGGSLTSAHALANLHQRFTGNLAAVATPLEAIANPLSRNHSIWLLSAGGGNVDILSAFQTIVAREPCQLAVLCGKTTSPLAALAREHSYSDLIVYEPPAGKDGFLATNSLLAFVTLLTRAYSFEFAEPPDELEPHLEKLLSTISNARHWEDWEEQAKPLWARQTVLVIHGFNSRIGAVDLESKFTEAAIGNLQIADYRNFAHGRHHWLAKRGGESSVIAFVSEEDNPLAERTLELIPDDILQLRLRMDGPPLIASLLSLVTALRITGWAGVARGVDPGRPGVPEFGRKLYHLPLPKERRHPGRLSIDELDVVAIERKSGMKLGELIRTDDLARWQRALAQFRADLRGTVFCGVVMDYDGTLVDARNRFSPPIAEVAKELLRLVQGGARIGIATGRGSSVKRDLRTIFPSELWSTIMVGYYNGAELGTLADDEIPDGVSSPAGDFAVVAAALRERSELADLAHQTDRRSQITLEARRPTTENRLWELAHQTLLEMKRTDLKITRSSHSVDIVARGSSKLNVLAKLRAESKVSHHLIAIGDRGRWPGNDYELLNEPFSLTVDELSANPTTCWHLAPRGQRGITAMLGYLKSLNATDGTVRFNDSITAS